MLRDDRDLVRSWFLFETANAYQRTTALKDAVDLGLFSAIASEGASAKEAADKCQAVEGEVRILCDNLTIGLRPERRALPLLIWEFENEDFYL